MLRPRGFNNQCGSVLVLTIWAVVVLSVLATTLSTQSSQAVSNAQRMIADLKVSTELAAIAHYAGLTLSEDLTDGFDGTGEIWRGDKLFNIETSDGSLLEVKWKLTEEEAKLPLNTATPEVLKRLFENTGLLRALDAEALADAVVDWRDEDSKMSPHGAESFSYDDYECKNAPFQSIEELLLIKGMTIEIYARVAPYLTPYGSGKVNINTAGPKVMHALGFSEAAYGALGNYRVGNDSLPGTEDDRAVAAESAIAGELGTYMPAEDAGILTQLIGKKLLTVKSEVFSVQGKIVYAETQDPYSVFYCVLDRDGNVYAWGEP